MMENLAFPTISDENSQPIYNPVSAEDIKSSFVYNFDRNNFIFVDGTPKEVIKTEAVKEWIRMVLRVRKNSCKVFEGLDIGLSYDELIGSRALPLGFARAELEREIKNTLSYCPAISNAYDFDFKRLKRTLEISFTCVLNTGEVIFIDERIE